MVKRIFDIFLSTFLLVILLVFLIVVLIICTIDTKEFGLFIQTRIGRFGQPFKIYKFRSMYFDSELNENRMSPFGKIIRKYKLDELPQLVNVLIGDMSFVGPRPDVPGYADLLSGNNRKILDVRPGITGPAQLKYKNEEFILAQQENPLKYNDDILWPDKVKINLDYVQNQSFQGDIKFIFKTLF